MAQQNPIIGKVQEQNFICTIDDDFSENLTFIDELSGNPEDITDWLFYLSIYKSWAVKAAGGNALVSLAVGSGFTITSPTEGALDMAITSNQTSAIGAAVTLSSVYGADVPQATCVYDFVAVDQNNLQRTRMRGNFIFQMRLSHT